MPQNPTDYTGFKTGKLTVIKIIKREELPHIYPNKSGTVWECFCECGNTCYKLATEIQQGKAKSCGCRKNDQWKEATNKNKKYEEGTLKTTEYSTWQGMIQRCTNPNNEGYHLYMGKGIKVCDRWLDKERGFLNFLEDMGKKPSPQHSLDRIDGNGNYEPSNCRWVTWFVQLANTSRNRWIEYNGEQFILAELARKLGIHEHTFSYHLHKGHSIEYMLECKDKTASKIKN